MLRFKEISIENFGPYKEHQNIRFDDGVNIVWGNNGRGKTTLLNAFRFALYGKVYGRDPENEHSLAEISNWENAKEGIFGFKVSLTMEHEGNVYVLTRTYSPHGDVQIPFNDTDYTNHAFLKKNNAVLADADMKLTLESLLPENISRFFLFDGELLSEYEDLLHDSKSIGLKIKQSIEKILGVPILTNGLTDIKNAAEVYSKRLAEELKRDAKSQKLGNILSAEQEELTKLRSDLKVLETQQQEADNTRVELEAMLRKSERATKMMERYDGLGANLKRLEIEEKEAEIEIKALNKKLWLACLDGIIQIELESIRKNIEDLISKETEETIRSAMSAKIKAGIEKNQCPFCSQILTSTSKSFIMDQLKSDADVNTGLSDQESELLRSLRSYKAVLSKDTEKETIVLVNKESANLASIKFRISQVRQELSDIKAQLTSMSGLDKIKTNSLDLAKCLKELEIISQSITDHEERIQEKLNNIKALEDKVEKTSMGVNLKRVQNTKELTDKLEVIFAMGRDLYTNNLRKRIEEDATKIFKSLSSEPEYEKLQINDNYGLNIVHEDGSLIAIRSAGYEHIVSLSLIGSLQKNAPMQGPVIIDSPFGRLDYRNKKLMTNSLHMLSHEVIVLLYDSEIDAQEARTSLGAKLVNEYKLNRITSRNTEIIEGGY